MLIFFFCLNHNFLQLNKVRNASNITKILIRLKFLTEGFFMIEFGNRIKWKSTNKIVKLTITFQPKLNFYWNIALKEKVIDYF